MRRRNRRMIVFRRSRGLRQQAEEESSYQNRELNVIVESNDTMGEEGPSTTSQSDESDVELVDENSEEEELPGERARQQLNAHHQERNTEQGERIVTGENAQQEASRQILNMLFYDEGELQINNNESGEEHDYSEDEGTPTPNERTSSTTTLDRVIHLLNHNTASLSTTTSTTNTNGETDRRMQHPASDSQLGIMQYAVHPSLETRLSMIVRCIVCKLAPLTPYMQCTRAHLMCAGCYQVRLSERATCPACQVRIYRKNVMRNHIAEAINAQLPVMCQNCLVIYVRGDLQKHQRYDCVERPFKCRYRRLGCLWQGTQHQQRLHEMHCPTANLSGAEISDFMHERVKRLREERHVLKAFVALLQRHRLVSRMFQHLPELARQIEPGVYLPLTNFKAYDHTWLIELVWRPTSVPEGGLSTLNYRLKLTTTTPLTHNLYTQYTLLRATYCEAKFVKHICRFEFSPTQLHSADCTFMADTNEKCKEMLNEKALYMLFYITLD